MKAVLKNIALFAGIALLIMPACLAIYQYFQFGQIASGLHRMSPDAIIRTGFSAILASGLLFAILQGLPLIQRLQGR